ncbi:NKAP family protein CG6066-like [Watersipora subatra]|uniref:NKAP family protein CG6066-like n=1 Tax=Watersipora subatra TaxID=2589382 RepID=UPI00355AD1B4
MMPPRSRSRSPRHSGRGDDRARSRSPRRQDTSRYSSSQSRHRAAQSNPLGPWIKSDYRGKDRQREVPSQQLEYMQVRREEREAIGAKGVRECWAASPEPPPFSSSDEDAEQKGDDSDRSSIETKKRSKKEKKKLKKLKSDKKKKSKKKKKRRSTDSEQSDSDSEDDRKIKKSKKKKKSKRRSESESEEEEWLEVSKGSKSSRTAVPSDIPDLSNPNRKKAQLIGTTSTSDAASESIGPSLPTDDDALHDSRMDFGKALLPGEGAAMAAYIADGKRIPRRGEIGLLPEEITAYEEQGFVMSGSRHRRMEAVRLRKENQIYSADEKRALAMFNYEERSKREKKILSQFKELVQKKSGK